MIGRALAADTNPTLATLWLSFHTGSCLVSDVSGTTPSNLPQPPAASSTIGTTPAASASGIVGFWKDCAFGPVSTNNGYQLHQISLPALSDSARDALASVFEHHYLQPAAFRNGMDGSTLARVLEARLPERGNSSNAKKDRAGDIGELLGIEWVRRHGNHWEVCCTLRWKESIRPRRGEDIIAVRWDQRPVGLLKGEAKAGVTISGTTINEARSRLDQDDGWPAPFTLDFLAEKLTAEGRDADALRIFEERFKNPPRPSDAGCTHLLFLLTSADPSPLFATHGKIATGAAHGQLAAIMVCPAYEQIRDNVHNRAIELARSRPTA